MTRNAKAEKATGAALVGRKQSPTSDNRGAADKEPAAEWVPVSDLAPWPDNPRDNEAAVDAVVDSIKRFGFGAPILARQADYQVIAGHTRLKAALKLGLKIVPVRFLDLDPVDARLLALADNKTGELADWNDAKLAALLAELRAKDVDLLTGTGFGSDDIERIIREASASSVSGEDPGPERRRRRASGRRPRQGRGHHCLRRRAHPLRSVLRGTGRPRARLSAAPAPALRPAV